MSCRERSLRALVEKWLGREGGNTVSVTRFSHGADKRWRHVRVEAQRSGGAFVIVFFRHDDGSWCVYPPSIRRPTMATAHAYEPRVVAH